MAFESQELERLCLATGTPIQMVNPPLCCRAVPDGDRILAVVHAKCHHPNALAGQIEEVLNERYYDQLERVSTSDPDDLGRFLASVEIENLDSLPGWLWAVFSDGRETLGHAKAVFAHRVKHAAFRALAFGKVELVSVG